MERNYTVSRDLLVCDYFNSTTAIFDLKWAETMFLNG